jgi:hypothetical protein
MRGSVLFFTFALAALGCGSEPGDVSGADEEQNAQEPRLSTHTGPPVTSFEELPIEGARSLAVDRGMAGRRHSDRALGGPAHAAPCVSPALCVKAQRQYDPSP